MYRELFRYQVDPGLVDQIRTAGKVVLFRGWDVFSKKIAIKEGRLAWKGYSGCPHQSKELLKVWFDISKKVQAWRSRKAAYFGLATVV